LRRSFDRHHIPIYTVACGPDPRPIPDLKRAQAVEYADRGQSKSGKETTMATLPRPAQPAPSPLLEVIEPLLSVPQAVKILGISQCTLRNWIQRKKIARVKVGGRVMFRPDTIREFIAYNTRPASG
jgi:excisionase family DNA binding protein